MANILDKIIEDKKESLKLVKKTNSLDSIESNIKSLNNFLNFKEVIANNKKVSLITEIKKASPSAGKLVKDFNHINIAKMYVDNGATCLSVLTEEKHFLGKLLCPIPRYGPRVRHEKDSRCIRSIGLSERFLEAASGGPACQL